VQIAKYFREAAVTLLLYRLLVDLYRRRVSSAAILLLLLLNELRLYADGDGGGGDVANQTAGYMKPDCPE